MSLLKIFLKKKNLIFKFEHFKVSIEVFVSRVLRLYQFLYHKLIYDLKKSIYIAINAG